MTVIIVLGMILAVITLLLISFVHVEIVFTDQLLLTIRYLFINYRVFPPQEQKKKRQKTTPPEKKEKEPEDTTIKLSDAFLQKEEEPELELKVRYLNINQGCNPELMERCRTLREYSEFVGRIRRYAVGETTIEEAVDRAVTECIAEGILADFLSGQRAEVIAMSIFEYNEEAEMKKLRKGEQEIGEKRGEIKGEIRGEIRGRAKGRIEGRSEGFASSCLFALESHGTVPEWLKRRITEETAPELVETWMKAAITTASIESFLEKTGLKAPESE